ncbi:MAG: ROK family protein [Chloroflexi bacterium]|nr:MAG: ROK family protein [Chloroflexota bacterium]
MPSAPRPAEPIAGVDVGGTKIQVVVTDRRFRVLAQSRGPTPATGGPEAVAAAIVPLITEATGQVADGRLAAIGIGAPGSVDRLRGVVSRSPNLAGWIDPFPLGPALEKATGAPVVVDNDVRIGTLGEHRLGAGRPYRDVLGVWFGTGVGGAVILGGELRRGRAGAAGEIGHVCVRIGGRRCGCGRRGCLEAYAGRASMERRARKLEARGRRTQLFAIMEKQGRRTLTSGVIARALDMGDQVAQAMIEEAVVAAGSAIASVVNVLDVEAVVIGGGLGTRLGSRFVRRIAAAMQPHLFVDGRDSVAVLPAELGDLAGALGAATEAAELVSSGAPSDSRSLSTEGNRAPRGAAARPRL